MFFYYSCVSLIKRTIVTLNIHLRKFSLFGRDKCYTVLIESIERKHDRNLVYTMLF